MKDPLWTQKYQPDLSDIQQESVRKNIRSTEGMNVIISGPKGCGKTAVARALANNLHGSTDGMTEINVADFFNRSKKEIRNDDRFEAFLRGRSRMAKRDMINRVITESASYEPVGSSDYRTILLDNAESIREDFQQSLRRTIERNYETAHFVISTRNPSNIIPPIKSRFFTVPMKEPTGDEIENILTHILDEEGVEYSDAGIKAIIANTNRNIRESILTAQSAYTQGESVTKDTVSEIVSNVETKPDVSTLLRMAEKGNYKDMRDEVQDMVVKGSHSVQEVFQSLNRTVETEYEESVAVRFQIMAGRAEMRSTEGRDRTVHISQLLSEWAEEFAHRQ